VDISKKSDITFAIFLVKREQEIKIQRLYRKWFGIRYSPENTRDCGKKKRRIAVSEKKNTIESVGVS
jgi:hypothetical protein